MSGERFSTSLWVMLRVGFGYDSHRFAPGRPLVLGGVRIEHDRGLGGHSDADAVLHAITDAIMGAIGAGDIGEQFPDTDPAWAGADSATFVVHALKLAAAKGLSIVNCDVTVICQAPTLTPYKPAMRRRIAELLATSEENVAVKAKTNEHMGWIGLGEGLAAMAVVTVGKR